MADGGLVLVGWSEFIRDLRRSNNDIARELRKAHREIANERREDSRKRAAREYGKGGSYARAGRAIQSQAFPDAARLRLRAKTDPRIFGAEFGAKQYPQFRAWRGNQWQKDAGPADGVGYAVYPSIREGLPDIVDTYGDRMMDAAKRAFPERGF